MAMSRFACLLLIIIMLVSFSYAAITPSSPLSIGQTLRSSNEVFELGFFSPNDSQSHQYVGIWINGIMPQVVVWVANREKPVTDSTANLTISNNGTLLLFDGKNGIVWSTGETFAVNGSRAELSDNGNFIVKDNVSGRTLWESFEHLGDTLLPFSKLTYNVATGEKRVVTSWKTNTDPSAGEFVVEITPQVPPQVYTMKGSAPYSRSGPWAKTRFTGIPIMDASLTSPISVQQDANGSSFSYSDRNGRLLRSRITPNGSLEMFRRNGTSWELDFQAPSHICEHYGFCGPFGLCVMSKPPKCECFKGFVPKSIEEWKRRNWAGGCVRRAELNCQGNSTGKDVNGFHPVANIKPPDFYEFISFLNAEECKQSCLHNCSCLAFAFIDGIGCLVWNQQLMDVMQYSSGGELLFIRLASSELRGGSIRKKTIHGIVVSLSLFLILGFAAFAFWKYRAKHNANISKDASQDASRNGLTLQDVSSLIFFQMNTIETATNNFSLSNKLGQGGFGSVYKGILKDGKEIAVKRLASSSGQGKEEFMNEIVLISKLQHKNLVRILGCCIEGDERLLIYEFMVNKSLDTFLFDSVKRHEIDWPKRFSIVQGIARGLHYLHRDSCLKVIHRDLKVSNILLDENMNPKISDFGLARMYQGTEYQENTRRIAGTLGYMAPEYAWTGMFSEKSDIYSFGILLLEIISGEKISRFTYGEEQKTLVAYAWERWCENGGIDLLDRDVADSCQPLEVERCVQVGLLCVQHQPVGRPNTLELLSMLTTASDLPSPIQPTFVAPSTYEPMPNVLITVNEMTESSVLGR